MPFADVLVEVRAGRRGVIQRRIEAGPVGMNLIVSRASKDYVLQVTGGRAPDNVLYHARNGIVAMAYAGVHEIGGVPTGRWLAENVSPHHDLGRGLASLAKALQDAPLALDSAFDLHVAGWQWSGRQSSGRQSSVRQSSGRPSRPVVAGISKDPGKPRFQIEYLPRYWYLDRGRPGRDGRRGYRFNVSAAPDGYIALAQLQRVVQRLRDLSPGDAESVLGGAIRGVAETVAEAGPHRLSILLYPPQARAAVVRSMSGAAAPWMVGPGGIAAPAALSGTKEVSLGTYSVSMEGPLLP